MMDKQRLKIALPFAVAVIFGVAIWIAQPQRHTLVDRLPVSPTPVIPQPIVVEGTIACLPHANTQGPVTLECAIGLQSDNGLHFALDTAALGPDIMTRLTTNQRVKIEGMFVSIDALSSNHWQKYNIQGIISVTKEPILLK